MKDNYNELVFHQHLQNNLFNTTETIYYVKYYAQCGDPPTMLTDHNVKLTQSILAITSQPSVAVPILTGLVANGNRRIIVDKNIEPILLGCFAHTENE